ncbi:MAG: HAD family hydrolase [Candidatus Thorarchaeota archaeon]
MYEQYCVIFDMDGVLADTGRIHFDSWVKLANEIGKKFTKDFFKETFGQTSPEIVRKLVGSDINQKKIEHMANSKEQYYREMVKDKLKPLPGVLDLIRNLKKRKFNLAVGSSGPKANVELLLSSLKIKKYFDCIMTGDDVKVGKPAPDVFISVSKKLNIKPKRCIVFEDAPVGITAAKRAGMNVIALTTTHKKNDLMNADLVFKDLSYVELKSMIQLLETEN